MKNPRNSKCVRLITKRLLQRLLYLIISASILAIPFFCVLAFNDFVSAIRINNPPQVSFTKGDLPSQKTDGSGHVDISVDVYDSDMDNARIKVEYCAKTSCTSPSDLTLLGPVAATYKDEEGLPNLDNTEPYQVGSSTGLRVITDDSKSPVTNTVTFDWDSKSDISDNGNTTYFLRVTANDGMADSKPVIQAVTVGN